MNTDSNTQGNIQSTTKKMPKDQEPRPIEFKNFRQNSNLIAQCIYSTDSHKTTSLGARLSSQMTDEIRKFLTGYIARFRIRHEKWPSYFRLDIYVDPNLSYLTVLEVNAAFVDGWGTALNLARASGIRIYPRGIIFPNSFATKQGEYLPELQLFVNELELLGITGKRVVLWPPETTNDEPVYTYCRKEPGTNPLFHPFRGGEFDDKLKLSAYANACWENNHILRVPKHFVYDKSDPATQWEKLPQNTVLKFVDKNDPRSARKAISFGVPRGYNPDYNVFRPAYEAGKVIGQEWVKTATQTLTGHDEPKKVQLIVLAIDTEPITGYVQFAYKNQSLINDNSIHGPLELCSE